MERIYVGIDPGVNALGIVIRKGNIIHRDFVWSSASCSCEGVVSDVVRCRDLLKSAVVELRRVIADQFDTLGDASVVVSVEGPITVHRSNAIQTGVLHSAIYDSLGRYMRRSLHVVTVQPTTLKKYVTGSGKASKEAVAEGVIRKWFKGCPPDFGASHLYEAYALSRIGEAVIKLAPFWVRGKVQMHTFTPTVSASGSFISWTASPWVESRG